MRISKYIILVFVIVLLSCESEHEKYGKLDDGIYADIQTNVGGVLVKLDYKVVPMTVGNFVSLAEGTNERVTDSMLGKPFYNGLKFHRVISRANGDNGNFMAQGGCPLGNGMGDPGYKFADEFPRDSLGELFHSHGKPGKIAMANGGPNGNGSQFYITIAPSPHLDGKHTVFGDVEKGFNIVNDSIVQNTIIEKIEIIRIGNKAKNFDAFEVFDEQLKEAERQKEELLTKMEILKESFLVKMEEFKSKATELPSGLKFYMLKEGEGTKPGINGNIRIHYSVFFTDGTLLDSNRKEIAIQYGTYNLQRDDDNGYDPFPSTYSMDEQLIQGLKEGLQQMKFGDQAVLFIPSHLAYGEEGRRDIAPNTDLIFELEMYPKE